MKIEWNEDDNGTMTYTTPDWMLSVKVARCRDKHNVSVVSDYAGAKTKQFCVNMENALTHAEKLITKHMAQCWETPPDFWRVIKDIWNPQVDVCATENNKKCGRYIGYNSPTDNGLAVPWRHYGPGVCWCNPPFKNIPIWLQKAHEETKNYVCSLVLSHEVSSAVWFGKNKELASSIWTLAPRINFVEPCGVKQMGNMRGANLFIFDPNVTRPPGVPVPIYHFDWKAYLAQMDAELC